MLNFKSSGKELDYVKEQRKEENLGKAEDFCFLSGKRYYLRFLFWCGFFLLLFFGGEGVLLRHCLTK